MTDNLTTWDFKRSDLQVVSIGDVTTIRREPVDPEKEPALPYVGLEHIDSGQIELNRWGHASEVRSLKSRFSKNDILYGKLRPYLDKAVIAPVDGLCSTDIIVMKTGSIILTELVAHILHTQEFIAFANSTTTGVNHPRTSWNAIQKFTFPLPLRTSQENIVGVLTAVRRALSATKEIIRTTNNLKISLCSHLFSFGFKKLENESTGLRDQFQPTLPSGWNVKRLGDLVNVHDKKRVPLSENERQRIRGIFPYCGANGIIDWIDRFLFEGEYLLLAEDGGDWKQFGNSAYLMKGKFWVNNHAHVLQSRAECALNSYLVHALNFMNLRPFIAGTTRGKLTQGDMLKIPIPIPSLDQQKKIAESLDAVSAKIAAEESRSSALENLYQTLLSSLMRGSMNSIRS